MTFGKFGTSVISLHDMSSCLTIGKDGMLLIRLFVRSSVDIRSFADKSPSGNSSNKQLEATKTERVLGIVGKTRIGLLLIERSSMCEDEISSGKKVTLLL